LSSDLNRRRLRDYEGEKIRKLFINNCLAPIYEVCYTQLDSLIDNEYHSYLDSFVNKNNDK